MTVVNGEASEQPPEAPQRKSSSKRRSKTPDASADPDATKKELKRARHIMRHLEGKMKAMEEQHRKQLMEAALQQQPGQASHGNRSSAIENQVSG